MFNSTLGKGIAITLAIFGIMSLASKMTVVTEVNDEAKTHQKKYFEQIKQNSPTLDETLEDI